MVRKVRQIRLMELENKYTHTHTHILCKALGSYYTASATARSFQSCLTLFDPSPGIFQARTLKWVAISFSNA